jgi:demethylspheroidene O-methyltransferase
MPLAEPLAAAPMRATRSGSLTDRLLAWRDRLLASAGFQRAAARFPLTRWIARRRAKALFDLVAGFTYSQVLLACVRLRVFELLLERPRSRGELAALVGLDDDAAARLLSAAIALRLVEHRSDERFGLGPLGAPMAKSRAITAMVEHHAVLYADLTDPVALLRGTHATDTSTRLKDVWGYAANPNPDALADDRIAGYSALMSASQSLVADQILDAYPLARHHRLLDVGGGEGGFAIAVVRRYPHLTATVFDLPAVAARAGERVQREGLQTRVSATGGDFARGPLPAGADVVTLVRVVHDHDDAMVLALLRAVHASLADDGVLLIGEPMSGTAGAEAMGDAYFGMYLLAMGSGRPRTPTELAAMLAEAGFRRTRLMSTALPLQTRLIVAFK